jgi:hypothetical protein
MVKDRKTSENVTQRVARIRAQMADGTLCIDSEKLADVMLRREPDQLLPGVSRRMRRATVPLWGGRSVPSS